jgi:hypothetical protein
VELEAIHVEEEEDWFVLLLMFFLLVKFLLKLKVKILQNRK